MFVFLRHSGELRKFKSIALSGGRTEAQTIKLVKIPKNYEAI